MGHILVMLTVAETPTFTKQAEALFSDDEKQALIAFLAANPEAGDIIPGTGGVRKVRYKASGRGKRGGARVIYFYFDDEYPLIALMVYAKNERDNISPDGKKMLAKIAAEIKADVRSRK